MDFREAVRLAEGIIERFEKVEGKEWGVEGAVIELAKQVGDLSKRVMAYEGYYLDDPRRKGTKEGIADELADVFYAIVRIARHYEIDLLKAHLDARAAEDRSLKAIGA